jgi:antitoxin VapB
MNHIAKVFINGRSQAIRLPAQYRFDTKEVFIHRDEETGDVILSRKPSNWDSFLLAMKNTKVPSHFLNKKERNQGTQDRDPFKEWNE